MAMFIELATCLRIRYAFAISSTCTFDWFSYLHFDQFVIASKSPKPDVLVFNYSKHSSTPPDFVCRPQHRLLGHSEGGYGLSWSPLSQGFLASASSDGGVCVWDTKEGALEVNALHKFANVHAKGAEDVDWSHHQSSVLASVGGDGRMLVWDLRSAEPTSPRSEVQAHKEDANCVSFNPLNEFVLATGASDGTVKLWDLRNLSASTHDLLGHQAGVYQLSWAPFEEAILASSGEDRRVYIWDTRRIGQEQSAEDAEDGPPELLFVHGGHTAKVFDFSWNANYPWCVSSVAEDNVLQVWQVAQSIYSDEDDEEGEEVRDEDLEGDDEEEEDKRRKRQKL